MHEIGTQYLIQCCLPLLLAIFGSVQATAQSWKPSQNGAGIHAFDVRLKGRHDVTRKILANAEDDDAVAGLGNAIVFTLHHEIRGLERAKSVRSILGCEGVERIPCPGSLWCLH